MIFTNKLNLPPAFVNAVSVERHNKEGSLSATTLLKGHKEIILQERHWNKIEKDVSEEVWAVWGKMLHLLMEQQEDNTFKEEFVELQITDKTKITGRVDCYDLENEKIIDWKTCSIWKVKYNDFEDWKKQLMIYAFLFRANGLPVKKAEIVYFIKDWSKAESRRDSSYPQSQLQTLSFDVTDEEMEKASYLIRNKVSYYESFLEMNDDEIPPCKKDERWATETKWAVMKEGRKSAIRVFDNKELAEQMLDNVDSKHYIEERKGESKKCRDYCSCNSFCNFYLNENNLQKPVEPKVLTSKDLKKHFHDENKRNKNTCDWCLTKTKELTKVASRLFDGENDLVCEDCLRDSEIEQDAFSNEY